MKYLAAILSLLCLSAIAADEFVIEFWSAVWDAETVVGVESSADFESWAAVKALPLDSVETTTNGMRRIPINADGDVRFYRLWISNSVSRVESPDFGNRQLFTSTNLGSIKIKKNP